VEQNVCDFGLCGPLLASMMRCEAMLGNAAGTCCTQPLAVHDVCLELAYL